MLAVCSILCGISLHSVAQTKLLRSTRDPEEIRLRLIFARKERSLIAANADPEEMRTAMADLREHYAEAFTELSKRQATQELKRVYPTTMPLRAGRSAADFIQAGNAYLEGVMARSVEAAGGEAQTTTAPLTHFKDRWELTGVTKIYKLEADINYDGLKEVFLAVNKSDPPEGDEVGWELYVAKPGGQYVLAGQKTDTGNQNTGPTFDKNQYWIGVIPELHQFGLLHLSCGKGVQANCQLKAIVIDGDAWKEIPIGEPVNAEKNYEQLAQRFPQTPTPAVQETNSVR